MFPHTTTAVIDSLPADTWDVTAWCADDLAVSGRIDPADVRRIVGAVLGEVAPTFRVKADPTSWPQRGDIAMPRESCEHCGTPLGEDLTHCYGCGLNL